MQTEQNIVLKVILHKDLWMDAFYETYEKWEVRNYYKHHFKLKKKSFVAINKIKWSLNTD